VSKEAWDALSNVEYAFVINAIEHDILPGFFGDLTEEERELPLPELAAVLMSLIDRGWIEVRPYREWIAEDGQPGLRPGEALSRSEIVALLAVPDTWEQRAGPSWIGAPNLVLTPLGDRVMH
jgi:hypothetical protein